MDFELRAASINDLDKIMEIEQKGFIPQIQERRDIFEKRILLCPQLFILIEESKTRQIAGYLSAEQINRVPESADEIGLNHSPDSVPRDSNPQMIYISSFSILPQFRGKGNGKKIWKQCMYYLEKVDLNNLSLSPSNLTLSPFNQLPPSQKKILILLVNQDWGAAKHIYTDYGFQQINIFKNFFQRQDGTFSDGILMKK